MPRGVLPTPYHDPKNRQGISRRQRLEMTKADLFQEMQQHRAHWIDCADFIKPRRPRWFVTDRNRGDRRNQKIIDSTASFSHRTLQSGMHAGMTNPARPWLRILTPDPDLNEYETVKLWLHTVTQRMLTIFAQTNLYNVLPIHYGDMGAFATAATAILNDSQDLFRAVNYPIGSYAIACNNRGIVDRFAHEQEMSVAQVVEEYLLDRKTNMIDWTNASQALKNCWDRGSFNDKLQVAWLCTPNADRAPAHYIASKSMPYYGCHFEPGQDRDDTFLREEGFNEFPVHVSRWDVTGNDDWGTDCPAMIALGDVKQLQTGERRSGQLLEKFINPPLQAPTHIRNQKASLLPGDITYTDVREGQKGIAPIHELNLQGYDKLEMKQASVRSRIQRAFYEDLFLMLAYSDPTRGVQPPTATEIVERKEEKLIALGPVLERTNDELLDPLVDRVFAMMDRAGLIPQAPEELHNVTLRVEYVSILAQAQKLVGVVGHERFLQNASALVGLVPEVRHKVNWMQAIDDLGDMLGVNPKLIVPDEQAKAAAQAEAQAAARQAQAEAMAKGTQALKNVATSPVTSDNVLGTLKDALQQ
jgi:hypothetical protein